MNLLPRVVLELLTPHRLFAKLNIASKMLLGYMVLVALTLTVVIYALYSLQRLNSLNNEIVRIDIPIQTTANKMLDVLVAQDTYEKRYLIVQGKALRALFRQRADEFKSLLVNLRRFPASAHLPLKDIETLHTRYNDSFERERKLLVANDVPGAVAISNSELKNTFEKLTQALRETSTKAKQSRDNKIKKIKEIGGPAFITIAGLCLLSVLLGVLFSMAITHHIFSSIRKLKTATERIAEGNFQYDPDIDTKDEIGDLARAFVAMGKRLKKLEEMYLDASPLTRLPGGVAVENVMNERLASGRSIAFCVLDLDNFKVFNDHYGYARGNIVIKETARIVETAVKTKGSPDDFVGHIDGDDFVVITTPARMREVCSEIIRLFDEKAPQFYDSKDLARGFIHGKNRQGREMDFPILTISIAVVTNKQRTIVNTLEASELAAELKARAKMIPTSVYVVDQRRSA